MKILFEKDINDDIEVIELQAELECIEEMKVEYKDKNLYFEKFYVEGKEKEDTSYIIIEKTKKDGKIIHKIIGKSDKIILFDRPPKYIAKK